ncbi:hypothetical protein MIND_00501200 [Mycena indigotica]|uniref:DUF7721 domain-containing protein n=1 Tax=Mycena indigotica TaxID=2126181 RepID=A0A8H6W605_9AGAR|nr:uncharacterized protein MIND_00501200 [Mycena indigotica]KAF7307079.1 hypothetical protein MIND_00501200 [Mycena indigotica]
MSSTNGIFNVPEPTSADMTTAAQAQAEAKTATVAREVEANAEHAKDVAENAAFVAQSKGPALTGQTATDRLQTEASIRTGQAVEEGKQSVAEAQAAGAGYVQQAKDYAAGAVASAQSMIPPGSGPNGAHTTGDVISGIQTGANVVYNTTKDAIAAAGPYVVAAQDAAKPYVAAAQEAVMPHVNKATDVASSYLPGSTTTTQTAPVEGKDVKPTYLNSSCSQQARYHPDLSDVTTIPLELHPPPLTNMPHMEQLLGLAQQFIGSQSHDHDEAVRKAAAENPDDEELYQQASKHVAKRTEEHRPPSDEEAEAAKAAHHKIYKQGDKSKSTLESMGSDAVGGAIATQAIQMFLSSGGKGGSDDLIAFAMKEASQLLGGDTDSGFKGAAMQKAAMMVFKSQLSGGGSGGGGAASLLAKFL